ncbi:hypothetical protein L1987_52546 [Smallanthus sonchifolius]|uniref:Uncharacterized protein n=1 Tax=Smallanthus sonchifolius TaxID=185202 RepID=A0ACB9EU61_9ASTR|nr:hypothetical protein L1987_52546 [Smallanthus sonchifolius]
MLIIASFAISIYAVQSDINCLRSIKESLEDPDNLLSSWDFSNNTEGLVVGQIPPELPQLSRLKEFSVANNRLSGQVPMMNNGSVSADSYAYNFGLCGAPLSPCENENLGHIFFSGFAVGFSVFTTLTMFLIFCCSPGLTMSNMISYVLMFKKIMGRKHHLVPRRSHVLFTKENVTEESKITTMGMYIRPLRLVELKLATNNFDMKNVIGNGNMVLMPQVEGKKMGWTLRLRIAVGIARGLAWLHYNNVLRVAHLKISSNCILLDHNFEPKISNFGNSNILMNTSGTLSSGGAFLVPLSSLGTYKEDVYSFGILLLELVSGIERPFAETDSLRDYVCGEEFDMIDECLMGQEFVEEIYETLRIAENCIRTHKNGATCMLEVYQSIRAIGISRNEISVDSCIDLESNEGEV